MTLQICYELTNFTSKHFEIEKCSW